MSVADLPKRTFGGVRLTKKEKENLKAWVLREGWTREKTINHQFRFDHSMPLNLVAPGIPPSHWSQAGKCTCVMCGHTTTVTNVCRHCVELPADEPSTVFQYCDDHKIVHKMPDGSAAMHRSINMVCVS